MSSVLVWFFLIPVIGIGLLVVLVPVTVGLFASDRRRRNEGVSPPQISDDGRFYWNGRKWKPLP